MSNFTLPSGTPIELRPIAAQEDLLLRDQKLLRKGLALDRVMAACVTIAGTLYHTSYGFPVVHVGEERRVQGELVTLRDRNRDARGRWRS